MTRWMMVLPLLMGAGTLEHAAPARIPEPTVPVTVHFAAVEDLPDLCGLTPERLVGCAKLWPGVKCEIWIGGELSPGVKEEVIAHEQAHCAGWSHED